MIPKNFEEKIREKCIPFYSGFELTNRCNLGCFMCFQSSDDYAEFSTEKIKSILDELADLGCLFITFTGGEPLIRNDFFEIIEYSLKKNFAVTLKTNGTLINQSTAQRLNSYPLYRIHISLLGATAKTHDAITKSKGSFDKSILAVKLLKPKSIITLATTAMKENIAELAEMKGFAQSLGVNWSASALLYPKKDGNCTHLGARLNDSELKNFYSFLFDADLEEVKQAEKKAFLICIAGINDISIDYCGNVIPCICLSLVLGNIHDNKLSTILSESEILKELKRIKPSDIKECFKCEYNIYCRRCPAMVYLEKNDVSKASDECCRHAKVIKEVIEA